MAITEDQVKEALATVNDPDAGRDLISLERVQDIVINDRQLSFKVYLTNPYRVDDDDFRNACVDAIHTHVDPEAEVTVDVSFRIPGNRIEGQGDPNLLTGVKNIIAVASGKGGVGKSSVAVNLACALSQQGCRVGIVDTDIYGPSIPTMMGKNERPNVNENKRMEPLESHGIKFLSMGLMVEEEQAVVWRGPMVSSAVKQFLSEADWGELDYLILDLPPGTGDIQLTIVQTIPLTGAVIVSTPQNVALDDVRKGVAMFHKVKVPVLGIVENMSYFTPPDLPDHKYYIFGKGGARKMAEEMDIPLLGEVPIEQELRTRADEGHPIVISRPEAQTAGALKNIAAETVRQNIIRNYSEPPTGKVNVAIK